MKTAKRIRRFLDDLNDGETIEGDPLALGLMDSLAIEQLIAFLEESFDIEFDDEELVAENFATIDDVTNLVETKRHARK
jgi:acyl carrier protein